MVLGIWQKWIAVGVTGTIFGASVDEAALKAYYESGENLALLGLYNTRFHTEYNTPEDIEIAKMTSVSLVTHFTDMDGYSKALEIDDSAKNDWLRSIGVERTYQDAYEHVLDQFIFMDHDSYDFWALGDEEAYYIQLNSPRIIAEDVEQVIYKTYMGRRFLVNYLLIEGGGYFDHVSLDFMTYTISPYVDSSSEVPNNIQAQIPPFMMMLLMNMYKQDMETVDWKLDVLDFEFTNKILPPAYNLMGDQLKLMLTEPLAQESIEDYELKLDYLTNKGVDISGTDEIDYQVYSDAYIYAEYIVKQGADIVPLYEVLVLSEDERLPGDELCTSGFYNFYVYMIDQYSLESYMDFVATDSTFEEIFGIDYESAKAEWLSYIDLP